MASLQKNHSIVTVVPKVTTLVHPKCAYTGHTRDKAGLGRGPGLGPVAVPELKLLGENGMSTFFALSNSNPSALREPQAAPNSPEQQQAGDLELWFGIAESVLTDRELCMPGHGGLPWFTSGFFFPLPGTPFLR